MRRWTAVAVTAAAIALAGGPAHAEHTPRLTGQVYDETGSTGAQARAAVDELLRERGLQLYVVFVRSTGSASGPNFAEAVARENGLGGNDAVLAVSPPERRYGMWVGDGVPGVSADEVNRLLSSRVEPELRDGDWNGAVVAAADGLADATGRGGGSGGRGGAGGARVLLALLVVGGLVWWGARRLRVRRAEREAAAARAREHEQLARDAAAALIRADEQLRDTQSELELAQPSFEPAEADAMRERMVAARDHVRRAFELRAQEEDQEPNAELLKQVLAECQAAADQLGAVTVRTAELRDSERTAPDLLAALPARLDALEGSLTTVDETVTALRAAVPDSARAVDGNTVEARKRVDYARSEVVEGTTAVGRNDLVKAARHARAAEQAVLRAEQLVAAVRHLDQSVADARAQLPTALTDAERLVLAAREVAAPTDARAARARAALEQARDHRDVLVAVRLAGEAEALAEQVLADAEQGRVRRTEDRRAAEGALASAEAAYTAAADFIAARREGIGDRPRARLRLAERELDRAEQLCADDPAQALDAARQAERLAHEAYELAADDFDRLERYDRPYGGGFGMGLPIPIPIPIILGGGGGWGGGWGGSWGGGWGGGSSYGGDFGGGGDSFGGTF